MNTGRRTPSPSRPINPQQMAQRGVLRLVGAVLAIAGGIFAVIGIGSFFSSMNSFAAPQYFWCAFVGLPLVAIGVGMLRMGYLGTMGRYVAGEITPVATDTFNYFASETSESARDVASAIGAGLRGTAEPRHQCPACAAENLADAHFCSQCGHSMQPATCSACQASLPADARFCTRCGASVSAAN